MHLSGRRCCWGVGAERGLDTPRHSAEAFARTKWRRAGSGGDGGGGGGSGVRVRPKHRNDGALSLQASHHSAAPPQPLASGLARRAALGRAMASESEGGGHEERWRGGGLGDMRCLVRRRLACRGCRTETGSSVGVVGVVAVVGYRRWPSSDASGAVPTRHLTIAAPNANVTPRPAHSASYMIVLFCMIVRLSRPTSARSIRARRRRRQINQR